MKTKFFLAAFFYILLPLRGIASDVDENAAQDTSYKQKTGQNLDSEKEITLADKAGHFEEIIRKRHVWQGFCPNVAGTVMGTDQLEERKQYSERC